MTVFWAKVRELFVLSPSCVGQFGKVYKCKKKANGKQCVIKIIDKLGLGDTERVRFKYEVDVLKNLVHPNIVQLYEVYENKSRIYLVTELCPGQELFDELVTRKIFGEAEAANVIKQVL